MNSPAEAGSSSAPPGRRPGGARRFPPAATAALALALAGGVALVVDRQYWVAEQQAEREAAHVAVDRASSAITLAVSQRLALLAGLHAFLEVHWSQPDLAGAFEEFAGHMHRTLPHVRSLQWVEGGVIRQAVPLAGNEPIVGYDLRQDPRPTIREDLARAETTEETVLTGPVTLIQGGLGLVGRRAVRDPDGRLLGVASVVLDLPPILANAGMLAGPDMGIAVRTADGQVFHGDSALFAGQPVLRSVPLPQGSWEIAAMPARGWDALVSSRLLVMRANLLAMVLLVGFVAWLLAGRRAGRERLAEARRLQSEAERLGQMFAVLPDGVLVTTEADSRILELNPGTASLLGHPREAMLGRTTVDLGIWVDLEERAQARIIADRDGQVQNFPAHFRTASGEVVEVLISARRITVDGEPCWLSIFRDVTAQRQLESRLHHAQKLEAVGRLAGGVAHDFNNLITAIAGYAEMLRVGLEEADARRGDVDEILRAAGRAAQLTQQLLAFARRQMVQPRVVELGGLVREVGALLRRLLGADVRLEVTPARGPILVRVDPGQMEQLLVNLAVNARDAMPRGGRLAISVADADGWAVLRVADTGTGMTPAVRAQAFEPFFTTKPPGKGTGLGLATVHGIVEQAGGTIRLESVEGQGTIFTVMLPLAAGPEAVPQSDGPATRAWRSGSGTILLAEDEPQVRRLTERALQAAGYEVMPARDGATALALARATPSPIDLLVTDLVMPEMGGLELAAAFRRERPGSRILFMSGYSEDSALRKALAAPGTAFLAKPFTPAELASCVRDLLAGSPAGAG